MNGLARLLHESGKTVTGSDCTETPLIAELRENGITVNKAHHENNLPEGCELVIVSHAIDTENLELIDAQSKKIPILSYPEAVGLFSRNYYTICIAGTHGKTTVTALIANILLKANFDPTVIIGSKMKELGDKSARLGKSKYLILEACEYRRSFLNYLPDVVILTNIDLDHLDYFRDKEDYTSAFQEFISQIHDEGSLIYNADDETSKEIAAKLNIQTIAASSRDKEETYFIKDEKVYEKGIKIGEIALRIPGLHNRKNALLAIALGRALHIDMPVIGKALHKFRGAWRRFEQKGYIGNTIVIDDYAHHPAEIAATLEAARERFHGKRIACVFQPHQFSRTKYFLKDFAHAFKNADAVIIPNIYRARDTEEHIKNISVQDLINELQENKIPSCNGESLEKTISLLRRQHSNYDVIITMGAGDVWTIASELTK